MSREKHSKRARVVRGDGLLREQEKDRKGYLLLAQNHVASTVPEERLAEAGLQ